MSEKWKTAQKLARRIGFAEMLRDVLVASISKGQFPFALLGLIVMASVLKMPPADVSTLVFRIVDLLASGRWSGYVLALLVTAGWSLHARHLRRALNTEMRRLSPATAPEARAGISGRIPSNEVRS